MIGFIRGTVDTLYDDRVLIENNGIGFEVFMPLSEIGKMPHQGEEVRLYTYLHVREDILALYGFLTRDACDFFKLLITVNGVGPKGALGILTALDVDSLRFSILANDAKAIAKAPGIGKKTAEKIVLELRDKCDGDDLFGGGTGDDTVAAGGAAGSAGDADAAKDAIEALVALGYGQTDSMRAVKSVMAVSPDIKTEDLLKQALKVI
ncbi:MAG: Holliday junction branch migration protein RuvA [Eubacterium sp.]|nr:Holliday junction branch migration protein RuvA [Eubacterium sp.]